MKELMLICEKKSIKKDFKSLKLPGCFFPFLSRRILDIFGTFRINVSGKDFLWILSLLEPCGAKQYRGNSQRNCYELIKYFGFDEETEL